jgi:hypothetical protein
MSNVAFVFIISIESLQKFLGRSASPRIQCKFHVAQLLMFKVKPNSPPRKNLVNLLHKVNQKVDQLLLVHNFGMSGCHQKADVVTGHWPSS